MFGFIKAPKAPPAVTVYRSPAEREKYDTPPEPKEPEILTAAQAAKLVEARKATDKESTEKAALAHLEKASDAIRAAAFKGLTTIEYIIPDGPLDIHIGQALAIKLSKLGYRAKSDYTVRRVVVEVNWSQ